MNPAAIHPSPIRIHGGTDAMGLPTFDFSTNSNATGPCLMTQEAIARADASRYPDASYTALCNKLASFHNCEAWRIVVAGSASEFIFRFTALAKLQGAGSVYVPQHSFGDYTHAAQAWGLSVVKGIKHVGDTQGLVWHCQPSSPLGQVSPVDIEGPLNTMHVLDLAYAPLQLNGECEFQAGHHDTVWQLYSPNKALGLTGVRAAYAIAPVGSQAMVNQLSSLAASWPLGAHGVALLDNWVNADTQTWLALSLQTLHIWKTRQMKLLESLGWNCQSSVTNFFCCTPTLINGMNLEHVLAAFRQQGIKLRDTTSFGLSDQVRVSVQPPIAQDALHQAWLRLNEENL